MPGARRPSRPEIVWLSRRKLCYSCVGQLIFCPLGFLFLIAGCLVSYIAIRGGLELMGLVTPMDPKLADQSLWKSILAGVAAFGLGALFVFGGMAVMSLQMVTFDRSRNIVTVRSGWLGLHRERWSLSGVRRVCVLSTATSYDVILQGDDSQQLLVGSVSRSQAMAVQMADEIRQFIGLKEELSLR